MGLSVARALLVFLAAASAAAARDTIPLLDVSARLMMVGQAGTQFIDERTDILLVGEQRAYQRTLTLSLGEARGALVDVLITWSPLDMIGESLLLRVESRSVLTSALGWSSHDVGVLQERRETLQIFPGQDHIYQFFSSSDLRTNLLVSFRFGSRPGHEPSLEIPLDAVTFRVRTTEGTGRRTKTLEERTLRSLDGREVGFQFRDEEPVRVPETRKDRSGLSSSGNQAWAERNLSEPIRIENTKKKKKQQAKMRKRMEKGKLTEKDKAILAQQEKRKREMAVRVEALHLKLRPVFTGYNVCRAQMVLEAEFLYPGLGKEARVEVEKVLDFQHADILNFDLLELAGVEPKGFPYRYRIEVQAYW